MVFEKLYGDRHVVIPVRDLTGRAAFVIDLNFGKGDRVEGAHKRELAKILKIFQAAYTEIHEETMTGETRVYIGE